MKATRLIRRSLAALLVGWLTRGAALASDRLEGDIAEILAAGHA
ncbi:MAG: hemin ABC transporter substrate-binding protein, partial [Gammaproteobacteria bacterium]|nr:hemin ABC transporter substrate-binding protein [Gammaproteobacteria bacterium]